MSELFTINEINLVSTWMYNLKTNDTCTICRESCNTSSLEYMKIGENSYIIGGICGHFFHKECIEKWTKKYSKNCPLCHKIWKPIK